MTTTKTKTQLARKPRPPKPAQIEVMDFDIIEADAHSAGGALCHDCQIDTAPLRRDGRPDFKRWDYYIVRDEVWAEAGMDGWHSGNLCMSCLLNHLKRDLVTGKDLLCWPVSASNRVHETPNRAFPKESPGDR